MTGRTKITLTVAITRAKRWPYYAARTLGPRQSAKPGELQIPITLDVDDRLLQHRSNTITVTLDAGTEVGAVVGVVQTGKE